jgi:hypothetical protein
MVSCIVAMGLTLVVAGATQAGTFDAANSSLTIRLAGLPPLAANANPGNGAVSAAGPQVSLVATPTAPFGPQNIDIPDSLFTGVPQISDLRIVGLGEPQANATFTGAAGPGGGFGGTAGLNGNTTICVFSCVFIQVVIPLTVNGQGGVFTGTALGQPLTVSGGFWTTGSATIAGINTQPLFTNTNISTAAKCAPVTCGVNTLALGLDVPMSYLNQVTLTGTNTLTATSGVGKVTLVTPTLTISLAGALPLFAIQTLTFTSVPEPGMALLTGAAITTLVALGRRRQRR